MASNLKKLDKDSLPFFGSKDKKAKFIQDMLTYLNNDGLTSEQILAFFKNVVDLVQGIQKQNVDHKKQLDEIIEQNKTDLIGDNKLFNEDTLAFLKEKQEILFKEQETALNFIRDKVRKIKEGKDGNPGRDADENAIFARLLDRIPEPIEQKEETAKETRDKLESIEDEKEKLNISAISDLQKELDDLKKIRATGGGGVSDMRIRQSFKTLFHTEEPVGLINGSNTAYTVSSAIWFVVGFSLNGEEIAELPNFTYAGKTITFSSALPAAYSGKDFEVKYIG